MFFSSNSRDNINGSNLWINDTLNYYYSIMSIMNVVSSIRRSREYTRTRKNTPLQRGVRRRVRVNSLLSAKDI